MKFALVNGCKIEPQPKLRGVCTGCQSEMVAKCGTVKVWHWSHKSKIPCDSWWEPETQWHRDWKNKFPQEWQESIHHDEQSGEKHIADVRTEYGLVIEFQHSHLMPEERNARERFYKNMVWVVDGTRLKNDIKRFLRGIANRRSLGQDGYFLLAFPDECFPSAWLTSSVPILFDFQGVSPTPPDAMISPLWCLLPGRAEGSAILVGVSRQSFVETASNRAILLPAHEIVSAVALNIRQQRELQMHAANRQFTRTYGRRRRF